MANELSTIYSTGLTVYGVLRLNSSQQVANISTSSFEVFNSANWAHYAITMTEQTPSGYYVGSLAAFITTQSPPYSLAFYVQAGSTPATTDTLVASGEYEPEVTATSVTAGVNVTQIAGQTASAAAAVTFPATIAAPGSQMDLVNAPNTTAIAAIKTDLGTIPASVAGSVGSVVSPVTLAASQSFNNSGQAALLPVDTYAISGVEISMVGSPAAIYVKGTIAATGDQMELVGGGTVNFTGSLFTTSYDSGATVYIVIYNSTGAIYTPSSGQFFSYAEPNWQYYAISASEQIPTGFYGGVLPTLPAASYTIRCFAQSGATPAPTDYCFATATYLPSTLASNLPSDYLSSAEQNQLNKIGTNSGDSPNAVTEQTTVANNLNATITSRAAPGNQMDLVNAPNTTALTAIAMSVWNTLTSAAFAVSSMAQYVLSIIGGGTGDAALTVTVKNSSTLALISGATVTLINSAGAVAGTGTTDINGVAPGMGGTPGVYTLLVGADSYTYYNQPITLVAGGNTPTILLEPIAIPIPVNPLQCNVALTITGLQGPVNGVWVKFIQSSGPGNLTSGNGLPYQTVNGTTNTNGQLTTVVGGNTVAYATLWQDAQYDIVVGGVTVYSSWLVPTASTALVPPITGFSIP